jgi:hypothetical protein
LRVLSARFGAKHNKQGLTGPVRSFSAIAKKNEKLVDYCAKETFAGCKYFDFFCSAS